MATSEEDSLTFCLEQKLQFLYAWRSVNPCVSRPATHPGNSCACSDNLRDQCQVIEFLESELAFFPIDVGLKPAAYRLFLAYNPNDEGSAHVPLLKMCCIYSHSLRCRLIHVTSQKLNT